MKKTREETKRIKNVLFDLFQEGEIITVSKSETELRSFAGESHYVFLKPGALTIEELFVDRHFRKAKKPRKSDLPAIKKILFDLYVKKELILISDVREIIDLFVRKRVIFFKRKVKPEICADNLERYIKSFQKNEGG